jgi:hypothetical protein
VACESVTLVIRKLHKAELAAVALQRFVEKGVHGCPCQIGVAGLFRSASLVGHRRPLAVRVFLMAMKLAAISVCAASNSIRPL